MLIEPDSTVLPINVFEPVTFNEPVNEVVEPDVLKGPTVVVVEPEEGIVFIDPDMVTVEPVIDSGPKMYGICYFII
jgi:hypothetical protein